MESRTLALRAMALSVAAALAFAVWQDRHTGEHAAAPAPARPSPIIVTPLPDPSVTLSMRSVNSSEASTFTIFKDGHVDAATETALKHFLRCRRTGREHPLSPGVLVLLVSVAQQWPGRMIEIVSAFRAPPFGALHSKHFTGHAIDLRVEGTRTSELRDFVWQNHHEVGVGYYLHENFVHMDWRPGEVDMAWSSGTESDTPNYAPRWAWTARHPAVQRGCGLRCS